MLTKLLTIKHWQLFFLIFLCPLVVHWCGIIYVEYTPNTVTNESATILVLATLVFLLISLTVISMWIGTIGLKIHDKVPHDLQLNQNRLTVACGFVFVALLFFILYISTILLLHNPLAYTIF